MRRLPDVAPTDEPQCPNCGHAPQGRPVRSLLDIIRRQPAHLECGALTEGDYGNGMSGGNEACSCRHPSHSLPTLAPVTPPE